MAINITINDIFDGFEQTFGIEEFAREQYVEGCTTYQFFQGLTTVINQTLTKIDSINAQNNIYLMTSIDMLAQFTEPFGYQPIIGRYNFLNFNCSVDFLNSTTLEDLKGCLFRVVIQDTDNNIFIDEEYTTSYANYIGNTYNFTIKSFSKVEIKNLQNITITYKNNNTDIVITSISAINIYNSGMGLESPSSYRKRFLDTQKDFFLYNIETNAFNKYGIPLSISPKIGFYGNIAYNLFFEVDDIEEDLLYDIIYSLGTSNFYLEPTFPNNTKEIFLNSASPTKIPYNFKKPLGIEIYCSYSDSVVGNNIENQQPVIAKLLAYRYNTLDNITQFNILEYLKNNNINWVSGIIFSTNGSSQFTLEPSIEHYYIISNIYFNLETIIS